ncbi:MAG: hypothetical protein M0P57_07840 [Syntrophales bacterium]|nr:hypothetical protein [Syntrophales bacterium]MDY0044343.1 hypothetical protein [Syntrophales bacterium]
MIYIVYAPDPLPMERIDPGIMRKGEIKLQGLKYYFINDGTPSFSLKADSIIKQTKKIGPFRIRLLKEITVENARVDIYGMSRFDKKHAIPLQFRAKGEFSQKEGKIMPAVWNDMLPGILKDPLTDCVLAPVCIRLHRDKSHIAGIEAAKAKTGAKGDGFLFEGNVRLNAEEKELRTERLFLSTETGAVTVKSRFVLQTKEKVVTGQYLETDFLLTERNGSQKNSLSFEGRGLGYVCNERYIQ